MVAGGADVVVQAEPAAAAGARDPVTGWFHASVFGAKGDWNGASGTDNLPAFEAAVAAVNADVSGRGVVYIDAPGEYWMRTGWVIDAEDIEVICHPGAVIRTTSPTQIGGTVGFLGHGIQRDPTHGNFVPDPQRTRAVWRGGRIVASGSGQLDNGIGVTRYKTSVVSDVEIFADRKALTAQFGVENIVWERVIVSRADFDGVSIETRARRVTLRDSVVRTAGIGVRLLIGGDLSWRNEDVLIENVHVPQSGPVSMSVSDTDRVTFRRSTGVGNLNIAGRVNGLSIAGDCNFAAVTYAEGWGGSNLPYAAPVALESGWVAFGAPFGPPVVRRTSDGFGVLDIAIKGGSTANGTRVAVLPRGYWPATRATLLATNNSGTDAGYIYIEPTGSVMTGAALSRNSLLHISGIYPLA